MDALGIGVVAASVDPIDKAKEVAAETNFPIGYGVTREDADKLGSWWEERRQIIQPTEFVLKGDNTIVNSSYSDGPLVRLQPSEVIGMVNHLDKMAAQK